MSCLTKQAMAAGVRESRCVILFLSAGVLTRPYVQFELGVAVRAGKKLQILHEMDHRHNPFDFSKEVAAAPEWIQELIESHESLPWQRRDYLRQPLVWEMFNFSNVLGFGVWAVASAKDWNPMVSRGVRIQTLQLKL